MTVQAAPAHGAGSVAGPALAHPWMPWSPCSESCLPGAGRGGSGRWVLAGGWDAEPQVGAVRAGLRMVGAFGTLLAGAAVAAAFPMLGGRGRALAMQLWFRLVLATFGVRLMVRGPGIPRGALVVANHTSWLDIVALGLSHRAAWWPNGTCATGS